MKTYKKALIILIIIVVITLCLLSYFLGRGSLDDTTLTTFSITKVEDVDSNTTLFFEKSKNATHYVVTITDDADNIINQIDTEKNRVSIQNTHAEYNQNININVTAFNKNEETLPSANTFKYTWINPSFDDANNKAIVTKDQDFSIKILGDVYNSFNYKNIIVFLKSFFKKEYIRKLNDSIYKQEIDSNYILIPYDNIKSYTGRLTAVIYDNNDNVCMFLVEFEPVGFIFVRPTEGRNMYWYCPTFGNHLHSVKGWAKYRFGTEENIPESFNEFNMIKDVRNYINYPSTLYFEAGADGQYVYYQKSPYYVANKLNEKLYYIHNAPAIKKNDKYYNLISDLWYGSYEETEKWEFMLDVNFLHKWTL